jgi:hypothetical protein
MAWIGSVDRLHLVRRMSTARLRAKWYNVEDRLVKSCETGCELLTVSISLVLLLEGKVRTKMTRGVKLVLHPSRF